MADVSDLSKNGANLPLTKDEGVLPERLVSTLIHLDNLC